MINKRRNGSDDFIFHTKISNLMYFIFLYMLAHGKGKYIPWFEKYMNCYDFGISKQSIYFSNLSLYFLTKW